MQIDRITNRFKEQGEVNPEEEEAELPGYTLGS
jgi:hypothetical protein